MSQPDRERTKIAILHTDRWPDATLFDDGLWECDLRSWEQVLNGDYGPDRGVTTSLPWNLGNAWQAADDWRGTLEVLVEIPDVPDGCVP